MRKKIKIISFLLLWLTQIGILAQDEEPNNSSSQFWLDFNPSYKVAERLTLYGAIGARTISPYSWSRVLITPSVAYDWPRLILKNYPYKEQLIAGLGIYFTNNLDVTNGLEFRPFQGYSITVPNRRWIQIKHYFKIEERFELQTEDWVNTFGLRLRYTGSVTFRFNGDYWQYGKGFYIPVSAEFFWNLIGTKQFNDKIRIVGGIGHEFASKWKAAFLFGYNLSKQDKSDDFHANDLLFRFRVYYKIPPGKKQAS